MSNQRGMFQQNPGAASGSSWGNRNGNQAPQSTPSSMAYDDDDDMSDDFYSDESDEEDAPLQISSWGEQKTKQDGTTEYNVSAEGWAALIDPNFKMGPGGIGSGNLHRKGGNYKPVDEEYILNHRLKKGSPMPKSAGGSPGGKKKKKKPAAGAGRGRGAPPPRPKTAPPPPSRSYTRAPPSNNAWGSTPLADKPFWEQPASAAAPPPPPTQFASGASASKYASGSTASRYAPQQPPQRGQPQPQQQQPPVQPQWGQQPQQQQQWSQQPPPPQQQPQQQWGQQSPPQQQQQQQQQPAPQQPWGDGSGASRYAAPDASSASKYAPAHDSSASKYAQGSAGSKWASGSGASKYAPTPMSTTSSADSIYASPEAKKHVDEAGPNILSINISFLPGVYATLNVPRQDAIDYVKLVEQFAADHHLTMEENAKFTFAHNIEQLVELELAKHR